MEHLNGLLADYGLPFIFVYVFLVQVGAPLPAVPVLMLAGALAMSGLLSLPAIVFVAIAASLAGDSIWYWLGRLYGTRVLRLLCRVSISPDSCVRQTEERFLRWGAPSLLFAKFIPGFSIIAPPLAGALGVRLPPFLIYSAVSGALWAAIAVGAGAALSEQIDWALAALDRMGVDAMILIGALTVLFIAFRWWERARFLKKLRMARISVTELNRLIEQGHGPVVVDVRSDGARSIDPRRIPGALTADIERLDEILKQLPVDRDIILYCS
jgi:membrane protein DedA with SNARE-associated domain